MVGGLHVLAKDDVLNPPGLNVKPSSNRCPESFFERNGLWPAGRLAFTERLFGLVLWVYELQLLAGLGRHRIVHSRRWRISDSGHVGGGWGPRGRT